MRHIYVHVPFCRRRCVYCDFAISVRKQVPSARFAAAVVAEAEMARAEGDESCDTQTLYFGGGTPSLLDPASLATLISSVPNPTVAENVEVTLEVNPEDATEGLVQEWVALGVNRASLGVQSFQPNVLDWMHRTHSAGDALRAADSLRDSMPQLSVDLIFALPLELEHDFRADLDRALALEPDHLSVYGLTVEPSAPLGKWVGRGTTAVPEDPVYAAQFMLAHRVLTDGGYEHYEISNYARRGCRSRHNSAYWTDASYVGLGPSAHSFQSDTGTRSWNLPHWAAYERCLAAGAPPTAGSESLDRAQHLLERLYLGLRTSDGVPLSEIGAGQGDRVQRLVESGLATVRDVSLILTAEGWLKTDQIVVGLTAPADGG